MKSTNKPVADINIVGDNNYVEVKVLKKTSSTTKVAIVIVIVAIVVASVLAVSHCCPEMLTDFVRFIISIACDS